MRMHVYLYEGVSVHVCVTVCALCVCIQASAGMCM